MSSSVQNRKREARGATLFMWLKIIGVIAFIATVFLLGANPFTGELPEGAEGETSTQTE